MESNDGKERWKETMERSDAEQRWKGTMEEELTGSEGWPRWMATMDTTSTN